MKRVLVVSDLHVGSPFALCLPEVTDEDYHMTYTANAIQNHFFDKWNVMRQKVGHVDMLIVNGDLIEGENRKENGTGVISTNIHAQAFIAATLINMIDADTVYITNGSKYHTGQTSGDQIVCQMIDGVWLGDHQFLKIEDLIMHVRHKIGYSSTPYSRCTGQRKEAMIMKSQGTNVDIYLRSHTHKFNFSGDSNDITINTPCWKGLDHFMNQGSQEMPDNGYVLFEIDGSNYKWDYNIFTIPHAFYKTVTVV
jgi:hypothetical protein